MAKIHQKECDVSMLARKDLDKAYIEWNHKWDAPSGRSNGKARVGSIAKYFSWSASSVLRNKGIFGFQTNNDTRRFEYPWAYYHGQLEKGMNVLEVGGGLSGFQFVLSKEGHTVHNVDPGACGFGSDVTDVMHEKLNRAFGTHCILHRCGIEDAPLDPCSFDRAFCISVIEHLPEATMRTAMKNVWCCLKPGGLFVLTIDLFLDLHPFSGRAENKWGRNISVRDLVEMGEFDLAVGEKSELYGFPEFDSERVRSNLSEYLIGTGYPTLVQAVVLRRK